MLIYFKALNESPATTLPEYDYLMVAFKLLLLPKKPRRQPAKTPELDWVFFSMTASR